MITHDLKEIEKLRKSGRILVTALGIVAKKSVAGTSAAYLDKLAEDYIRSQGARPAFKGHKSSEQETPFPASLCVSKNSEVVHGIPTKDKILESGDIVGLDLGVDFEGFFTDAAITIVIDRAEPSLLTLLQASKESLESGLKQVRHGNHIGDIGYAIESTAKSYGYKVVRDLVGHGVGKSVWEEPEIPCYGEIGKGGTLLEGMVLAIEPMLTMGTHKIKFESDGWTVRTADDQPSAHFEHTVLVKKNGCEILTKI
jgi:methionyl aminopeptidase